MKIKLTLMVLLIIALTSGCAKNTDQNSNNNLSTKIQELGDNPTKAEIEAYAQNKLKGAGLSDKEINEFKSIIKNINHGLSEASSQLGPKEQKELALSFVKSSDRKDFEKMLSEYKPPSVEENFADIQKGNITVDNAGYFINQCVNATFNKDFDKAIKICSLYLEKFPKNIDVLEARALSYLQKRMLKESLIDVKSMIEAHPKDSRSYFIDGLLMQYLKKYQYAINSYNVALKLEKNLMRLCSINHHMGLVYEDLGDTKTAKKYFTAEEKLRLNMRKK